MYVDVHVHLHEFPLTEIEDFVSQEIVLVAVSDDYESSIRTLELRDRFPGHVKACVGVHPWHVKESLPTSLLDNLLDLLREADCVGEVGVDLKFVPGTFHAQREVFIALTREAAKLGKPVNVHAAGAWREAIATLRESGVRKALIHWYTGPEELLSTLLENGYFASLNPAMRIQRRHRELAAKMDLRLLLTESDGPYEYRGLRLSPKLVPELVDEVAILKGLSSSQLAKIIWENFNNLFSS